MGFLCLLILVWTFLEASLWWVAPDVSIGIAYVYFPRYWKRFLLLGFLGALAGTITTYLWAAYAPQGWFTYVNSMPFHSQKNITFVNNTLAGDSLSIIKGAWGGIPYKLFIGVGATQGIAFMKLALQGLISRAIRFSFVLAVTAAIRYFTKPWSERHPAQLTCVLLTIWGIMLYIFDAWINKLYI